MVGRGDAAPGAGGGVGDLRLARRRIPGPSPPALASRGLSARRRGRHLRRPPTRGRGPLECRRPLLIRGARTPPPGGVAEGSRRLSAATPPVPRAPGGPTP